MWVGVGGWAGGVGGVCPLRRVACAAAAFARVMRGGRAGHASSPFQTGDGAGMTGDVAPLNDAFGAQGSGFRKTAAQRVQRRLFRPSSASAKTATWADVEEARTGREVRWARLVWVRHEAQEVNVLGLWPLLLHDVNVQEKRGAGAVVGVLVGCDWVMMTGVGVGAGSARWCGLGATAGLEDRCDRPCPCGTCFDDNPDR